MLIQHVRDAQGNPFATVVGDLVDGKVKVGVAVCNPKDFYRKAMGVKVATGRLQCGVDAKLPDNRYEFVFTNKSGGFLLRDDEEAVLTAVPVKTVVEDQVKLMQKRVTRYFRLDEKANEPAPVGYTGFGIFV